MRITSLSAKNFRTLEDFYLSLGPRYCAVSGRNNAGKSAVVHIVQHFFSGSEEDRYNPFASANISFTKDVTQWSSADQMEVSVTVQLDRTDDAEVFFVVETYSGKLESDRAEVRITQIFDKDGAVSTQCWVDNDPLDSQKSSEILKKFRSASNLIVHNSISPSRAFYFMGDSMMEILEAHFSAEDREKIAKAEKGLQSKVKKATKQHKEELDKLLGKLADKYQVELSSVEATRSSRYSLQVRLTDRSVEVPLKDWGGWHAE